MADMVMCNEGKQLVLDEIFRLTTTRESFVLDLFQSNTMITDASVAASFTIATFAGYAQIAIARTDWSAAVIVADVGEISKTTAPTWTCTGGSPQTVYGWILRGATSNKVYFGQNFAVARVMSSGSTETLNPFKIKDKTFV